MVTYKPTIWALSAPFALGQFSISATNRHSSWLPTNQPSISFVVIDKPQANHLFPPIKQPQHRNEPLFTFNFSIDPAPRGYQTDSYWVAPVEECLGKALNRPLPISSFRIDYQPPLTMHSNTSSFRYQQRHAQQLSIRGGPIFYNSLRDGFLGELLLAQTLVFNFLLFRPRFSNFFDLITYFNLTLIRFNHRIPFYYIILISILIIDF